jgi:hypothetical protein
MAQLIYILVFGTALFQTNDTFDADGYYFPTEPINVGETEVAWFGLQYTSTKNPEASLQFKTLGNETGRTYQTEEVVVTVDTVYFQFTATPIGTIRFQGRVVDRRGSYWNQGDITPHTVVLVGIVSINEGSPSTYSQRHEFTYSGGD